MYREISRARRHEPLGVLFIDSVCLYPRKNSLLITGEAESGVTALCLEISSALTSRGQYVLYVDPFDTLLHHRMWGIDRSKLLISKAIDPKEVMACLDAMNVEGSPTVILDLATLFFPSKNPKEDVRTFAERIRSTNPNLTVIATARSKKGTPRMTLGSKWTEILKVGEVKQVTKLYHLCQLEGSKGSTQILIEYRTGRVSRGYLKALELEGPTGRSGMFRDADSGLEAKGFWNFTFEYDKMFYEKLRQADFKQ